MRPLYFDFPEDKNTLSVEDAYMFGPDLLVAPVMEEGVSSRSVYLPAGASWKECSTGKVFDGGQTVTANAPLDVIPVFSRNGKSFEIYT